MGAAASERPPSEPCGVPCLELAGGQRPVHREVLRCVVPTDAGEHAQEEGTRLAGGSARR